MNSYQTPPGGYPGQRSSRGRTSPQAARLRQLSDTLISAAGRINMISNNLAGLAAQVNSVIGGTAGAEDTTIRQAFASTSARASKTVNAYKKTADQAIRIASRT